MAAFRSLQVGNVDTTGSRFNGQDLHRELLQRGYESDHLVWEKKGDNARTSELVFPFKEPLTKLLKKAESDLSLHSILHPAPLFLSRHELFKAADLIHYHLLHTGWFSIFGLPRLTKLKPSLLTLHDPWWLTGHCIYPRSCDRYLSGCGNCPDLKVMWEMKKDNTAGMWQQKKRAMADSELQIVVASKYMLSLSKSSPITGHLRHHLIPFGVALERFKPGDGREKRKKLGIHPDNTVICLRATVSPFKGLPNILEALERLETDKPLTILTFEHKNLFRRFLGKHQLIDLGWVDDPQLVSDAYGAADIFLMPSAAEAFGVMAVEAMACGKPVIVFEGTSLPEVTFAPDGGIAVPQGNSEALCAALKDLIEDEQKRLKIGEAARSLAIQHYDWRTHVKSMIALYEEISQSPGRRNIA